MDEPNNLTENIIENNINSLEKENVNYNKFNSIKQSDKELNITSKGTILSETTSRNLSNCDGPASNISSMKKCMNLLSPIVESSDEFVQKEISLIPNSINNTSPTERSKQIPKSTIVSSDLSNDKTKANAKTQRKTPLEPTRKSKRLILLSQRQNTNLVQGGSTLDHKTLTSKNKLLKKVSIVFTRFHSPEVQVFKQIVEKLGVFFAEDEVSDQTTHLVASDLKRTINLLRAIARGCWVLKSEWLYRSLEAGSWLPEENFELTDFSIAVQKARQERQAFGAGFSMDIFENCGNIYISRATIPRCSDLQELVTLCKGSLTTIAENAEIVIGEYIKDKSCLTVNWIMDSITFYERKSFTNYIIEAPEND